MGEGTVYHAVDGLLHGVAIPPNAYKVTVYRVHEGKEDRELPYPTEEMYTVRDAMSSFVAWPKHLVVLTSKVKASFFLYYFDLKL